MLRHNRRLLSMFSQNGDVNAKRDKAMPIRKEVGMWLYKKDSLQKYQQFCSSMQVRARGKVKIVQTENHARCLRLTKDVYPGEAIVTAPPSAGLNFLVANRAAFRTTHNFPLEVNAHNWNQRYKHLQGAAVHELALAGWIVRYACREDSPWTPFCKWLLEDTTGRDGVASGIGKERGDENPELDKMLGDMAYDAGEEVDDFTEFFFRAYASIQKRSSPVEPRVVSLYQPGSNIDRVDKDQLFVPTLVPLIDCVPHEETGAHNCMIDYHCLEELTDGDLLADMCLTDKDTSVAVIGKEGLISLRAITYLEAGTYLQVRGWPKTDNIQDEYSQQTIMEQTIAKNNAAAT